MNRVFLKCIISDNLGDDLLISTLCNRYKSTKFTAISTSAVHNPVRQNLRIIKVNELVYRIVRKISLLLHGNRCVIDDYFLLKSDFCITIGGSIFMEKYHYRRESDIGMRWYQGLKKKYYIIGANIGPVRTEKYLIDLKKYVLSNASDVCVRDKKSFGYIAELDRARLAPDIVFGYDFDKYSNMKEERKVFVSVIDIERKKNQMSCPDRDKYENLICELVKKFQLMNYDVCLASFCKSEGDEEAIERIMSKVLSKGRIEVCKYKGNLDEVLSQMATSRIIVGTRFHANVIGMRMNKVVVPIIYNDKTKNLLSDIKFNGLYFDANAVDCSKVELMNEKMLSYRVNLSEYAKKSKNHFKILDKVLGQI